MKIVKYVTKIENKENFYSVSTNNVELRIWFLTDDIIRIRAGFDGDWDEASYSLVKTAWDSRTDSLMKNERTRIIVADSRLIETEDKAIIEGSKLRLEIEKNPFRISVYDEAGNLIHRDTKELTFREDSNKRRFHTSDLNDKDYYYGFGEKSGEINKLEKFMVMAPGDSLGYNPKETDSLYKHIPFYIRLMSSTKNAVGYFYHSTSECSFNMGRERRNYWARYSTFEADQGDIDLFLINGPKITDVIERYTDLTGKSFLLPKASFGYLGSSMYYPELKDGDDGILEFIDTVNEEQIPIDGFQLSSGYCNIPTSDGIKRCSFTWNYERFKDPKKWFSEMIKRGIAVSPNIKPGMLLAHPLLEEMKRKNMFVLDSESNDFSVGTWWGGPGMFVDLTNAEVRNHWKDYIKDSLLKYGCESIWNDNCEYDSLVDKDARVSFEGKGSTIGEVKSIMSNLMCQLSNEAIEEYHGVSVRPYSVCRSGHAGIQRYAQVWAGDNYTSWDSLKYNIATILGMGLSGVANHGCDVGGFFGNAPEAELLVRWVQNGIFMPRFSIHSVNLDNTVTEPWMYTNMTGYIRDAIKFRYRLAPLFYSLEYRASVTGLPIMQPTFLVAQNDEKTYNEGVDFFLGDSLLVANVVEKGQKERSVYLPKSEDENVRYYDFYTRDEYQAGETIIKAVDIESIPLFVRSGAIIPTSQNQLYNLMNGTVTGLKILMAPDIDSSFTLYDDDGKTNEYKNGKFLTTEISVKAGSKTIINFNYEGEYQNTTESMELDIIHRQTAPFYVKLNNEEIPHFLHRAKYEKADYGWYYSNTLKSVLVKYPNPKKNHEVVVSFEPLEMLGM